MSSSDVDPNLPLLDEPAGGVPKVISTPKALADAVAALEAGTGPVAVDAERASGIRYGSRAFLIQLKRAGTGILLLDPEAFDSLEPVGRAIHDAEWILHASSQDLPCLAEAGMVPTRVFDTEIAARLLGEPKFGLASLIGAHLGVRLAKEHSYVDWSQRPLPHDWLAYAALDVELLIELRDILEQKLRDADKWEIAQQEFAHAALFTPKVHPEPWRRVHGLGAIKNRRGLGRVRAMWAVRDDIAEERDVAPGRIIADRAMVQAAGTQLRSSKELLRLPGRGRPTPADARELFSAVQACNRLPEDMMPTVRDPQKSTPRLTRQQRDAAKDILTHMKSAVNARAEELDVPHDLLITPALVRELASRAALGGDHPADVDAVEDFLRERGAREWQIAEAAPLLCRVIDQHRGVRA